MIYKNEPNKMAPSDDNPKPSLGPLERGLCLLRLLSQSPMPLGFSHINNELGGLNKATLSKLLKVLVRLGYIYHIDGKYSCGESMRIFAEAQIPSLREVFIARYAPVMRDFSSRFGISLLLFQSLSTALVSVHKTVSEFSPSMQELGGITSVEDTSPWGFLLRDHLKGDVSSVGYFEEVNTFFADIGRMAFDLRDNTGALIGCMGVGYMKGALAGEKKTECINELRTALRSLSNVAT